MAKEHDQKRAERAKAREDMRQKHSLKPNETDQQILKEAEALPWVKVEEEESGLFAEASTKIKDAWDSVANFFQT